MVKVRVAVRVSVTVSVTVSAATATVTWEAPHFWDHDCKESSCTADPLLPGNLQEHVTVTPGGSRKHSFKHISPGGTSRVEHYKSPADRRMAIEETEQRAEAEAADAAAAQRRGSGQRPALQGNAVSSVQRENA